MDTGSPAPEAEAILDRARALAPHLAAQADEAERCRTMPRGTLDALAEADLFRILSPPYLGGLGLDIPTHLRAAVELAKGCGSAAWVQCLVGYQNFLVGWYPPEAQDEVRADGQPLFAGLVMAATQPARAAPGGVMLDGRWPYVSGIDNATWVMLSARDPDWSDTNKRAITCLIPRGAFEIDDDWHVMGLRGTGSKSALLSGLFVPEHRILSFRDTDSTGVPGAAVNSGPYYRGIPTSTLFVMVIAAPAFGIAACAIDAYRQRLRTRSNPRMPAAQTEWPSAQMRLGRAVTRLEGACALYFGAVDALCGWIQAGGELTVEQRQGMRLAVVEAVGVASAIVYDLFCDAGTGVIREGDTLQRCFRDIHALRSHFMLSPDLTAENAGRVQLGLPPKAPFL